MDDRLRELAGLPGISARDLLEAAPDALLIASDAGAIVRLNPATAQLFGYDEADLVGQSIETLIAPADRDAWRREWTAYQRDPRRRPMARGAGLHGRRRDGTEFEVEIALSPLPTARSSLAIAAIREGSDRERKYVLREQLLHTHISHLARHDPLTGLPNRALLHDRIAAAIAAASRQRHQLAVLFLDLDRFQDVNASLGHGVGDWLLESVAARLTGCVSATDTVSRQGGDEFVILLTDLHGRDEAARTAAKILRAVTGVHRFGAHELHVDASIGIAIYPDDARDSETLIKNADLAMCHAKEQGRDRFHFFTEEMNARLLVRRGVERRLRGALERGEFVLHYQPKIDLHTGMMIGAEALLRWRDPERGVLPPETFVSVAEDTGLIVPIGRWVLREACRQAREWQSSGLHAVPVAVNISAIELRSSGFLEGVRQSLRETGLDPHLLEVELTESVLLDSIGTPATVLRELKAMGLRLAVDDFGTGYSSLSYLTQFPIDALKVDQSFVRKITGAGDGSPIITAVISMGKSLKHRVIAEGVETAQQLAFLQAQQCEEGQGFHFSRPLAADQFAELLLRG